MAETNAAGKGAGGLYAEPRRVESLDECLFYHTLDLPGVGTVRGFWDIRGREAEYLGHVEFGGRRVLEVGPASGQMSFFMERQGAEVVAVDVTEDHAWEFFWDLPDPAPGDLRAVFEMNRGNIERIKNSWWFSHRAFHSKVRAHYRKGYELPPELGEFDVSVLACVMLHTKYPVRLLENCARVTRDLMVVVEPFRERQFAQSGCEFLPVGRRWWDSWWGFAPRFFVETLHSMGFEHSRVTFHTQEQLGRPEHLFTVVASREPLGEPGPAAGAPLEVAVSSHVERLRLPAGGRLNLPVNVVNLGESLIHSFTDRPLLLSYHWRAKGGEVVLWDGIRTFLPRVLHRGDAEEVLMLVRAPDEPGEYLLEITFVKEGAYWYDEAPPDLPLRIATTVGPPESP